MSTVLRRTCGTHEGLRSHQDNGESPCARCLHGEAIRRLELEGIPTWPDKPSPVTPERAAENLSLLADAISHGRPERRAS
jgi:hypothetical protein